MEWLRLWGEEKFRDSRVMRQQVIPRFRSCPVVPRDHRCAKLPDRLLLNNQPGFNVEKLLANITIISRYLCRLWKDFADNSWVFLTEVLVVRIVTRRKVRHVTPHHLFSHHHTLLPLLLPIFVIHSYILVSYSLSILTSIPTKLTF